MNNETSESIIIDADQAPTPQPPSNPSQEEVEDLQPILQATPEEEEESQNVQADETQAAEDGNDNDLLEDDDDLPANPNSAKCVCGKWHPKRQPGWIAQEHIRFASLFSKASMTTTVQRLFRPASAQELDDRNLPPVWEVFAQEFNNPTCRVEVLEPLDDTWDFVHYSGHNPNQLVHTRNAEQMKIAYTRKRAALTVLCANYEKSGFNERERFQYLNSVKNEKADASLYYWWLVIESQNLKSSVVKKLDDGVGGSSSQPSQPSAKKKTAVKRESSEPSDADVAILDACNAHRDFLQLQTRQTQSELDLQHAAASKVREDMKIVTMIASSNDMDPVVRAKANEKLLAWLSG